MTDRDLKLNSIRGLEESPRLVLEEHGSCEVPAGSGSVITRPLSCNSMITLLHE